MSGRNETFGDLGFLATQEGVRGLFDADSAWYCRFAACATRLLVPHALLKSCVGRLNLQRKSQIGDCVLVCAKDLRRVGQGGQLVQRGDHLFRCAFEQTSAPAGEQRVAAEQPALIHGMVGDVASCVAGNIDHLQSQRRQCKFNDVAFAQAMRDFPNGLISRTVDRYLEALQQLSDAADMVRVVMCQ